MHRKVDFTQIFRSISKLLILIDNFIYKKNYFQTFNQRYFKTIVITAKLKKNLKKEEPKVT